MHCMHYRRGLGQTEHVDNNANPTWCELALALEPPAGLPLERPYGGLAELSRKLLRLEVYDHNKPPAAAKLIGVVEVGVDELLAGKAGRLELRKDGKGGRGWLVVDGAEMV